MSFISSVHNLIFALPFEFLLKLKNSRPILDFVIIFDFFLKMLIKNSDLIFFLSYLIVGLMLVISY